MSNPPASIKRKQSNIKLVDDSPLLSEAREKTIDQGRQASPPRSKAEQRRRKIFRSLHDCIIENGYSKTTLAHIAKGADMSPSHLLYYFPGKDRILEEYFADVATWFLKRVSDISTESPDEQIRDLTALWFGEGSAAYDDIGFMLECFGEAVHDGEMRLTKSNFDRACKSYLMSLFPADSLGGAITASDAAEIAYSLLIGLRNSVYFDRSKSTADAARCFREAIETLRGSWSA
ncbi:MAG: hypothetical protein Cons2KO_15510 [Congregibacter sp.]